MTETRRPTPGPPRPGCTLCGHWAPGGLRKVGPASRHWAASHGRGSVNGGWGLGHRGQGRAPRAARQLRPGPHRPHGGTPGRGGARPEYLRAGGRRSEGCTCVRVCPGRMGGATARGSRPGREPHAERAEEGGLTLGAGGAASLTSPPPLRAGARAVSPRVGAQAKLPGRTDGREAAAAARARLSRALSRRCRIAGRRCRRRRRAGGRAAGGAVRPRPGRTAGPPAAAIGPRRRPPPPPIGHRAAPLLRHRPAGGAPGGTRGKVGRNLRAHGGRGRDGSERGGAPGNRSSRRRRAPGSGRRATSPGRAPRPAVPPLNESALTLRSPGSAESDCPRHPKRRLPRPLCTDPL